MPYVYLLKHKPTKTFYYGVRYRTGCHPTEFWRTYFTSSVHTVPLLRTLFGDESFEFEIRKTFTSKSKARKWEELVLRRMKVLQRPDLWLNRTDQRTILNIVNPQQGKKRPQYVRDAISLARKASVGLYCWINNSINDQRIKKEFLQSYLNEGWNLGRLKLTGDRISAGREGKFSGKNNPSFKTGKYVGRYKKYYKYGSRSRQKIG